MIADVWGGIHGFGLSSLKEDEKSRRGRRLAKCPLLQVRQGDTVVVFKLMEGHIYIFEVITIK